MKDWDKGQDKHDRAKAVADQLRSQIAITSDMTALEFGCGTGLLGFNLIPYFAFLTFADSSEGMLEKVKEKYGDKIAVMGNLSVDLLGRGTPEEIHKMTKAIIDRTSPGGGHIFSSDNSIPSGTKEENLLEMIKVCKEHGAYPIKK